MVDLIWKWIRGVHRSESWNKHCVRCGFSGRVHYTGMFFPCVRFKPPPKETTK